ncbi:transcriptional antiterminator, BglG family [Gracilibacillus ureilyticus]|uniref:Transcriptional antiterminator, BglG family n=1 Tax=Gracilibacillus ureilyticus TaxID=531814 RepID=A0A1H9T985_9BACI|nr:PRD domain-containing protein [Gracilibacillus ureilyticus]SER93711.1 transcriptional antiterminator, BglG family [Gracilibacillus ureilyticus]
MRVIKKINNNVAICRDSNNKELIAFGKGIGFPVIPYNITDLSKISMTFYRIDSRFYTLIEEIPEDILEVAALIADKARVTLKGPLNPNLVIGLSDHINFAIVRMKKYKKMKMLFSYDVEQLYPNETKLGRYAVNLIQRKLYVTLPDSEITNIAMHFVNAQEEKLPDEGHDVEVLIAKATNEIEQFFSIKINRNDFNYNRFAMHMRYYIKRIRERKQFIDNTTVLVDAMKENIPKVYECAYRIGNLIDESLESKSNDEEIVYLMIHINRMIGKTKSENEGL